MIRVIELNFVSLVLSPPSALEVDVDASFFWNTFINNITNLSDMIP